jgi:hypothetical protein
VIRNIYRRKRKIGVEAKIYDIADTATPDEDCGEVGTAKVT